MKLIVYGTLMWGESNHEQLEGAAYLGDVLVPNAVLYDLGGYPGLKFLPIGNDHEQVHGELYEVVPELLKELDRFEGVPHLYDRVECHFGYFDDEGYHIIDGTPAFIYEYQRDTYEPHMPNGDWKKRHMLP